MKKSSLLVLALALCLTGCKHSEIFSLDEVEALISEKGYTKEQFTEKLAGRDREDIVDAWGEPSTSFSGMYGDIWMVGEDLWVVLYYDRDDDKVTDVIVGTPEL